MTASGAFGKSRRAGFAPLLTMTVVVFNNFGVILRAAEGGVSKDGSCSCPLRRHIGPAEASAGAT
jgi:hypothetical protein